MIALCFGFGELFRFVTQSLPFPIASPQVIIWLGLLLGGTFFAVMGTFALARVALLSGALILCCLVCPLTPTLIELSEGE